MRSRPNVSSQLYVDLDLTEDPRGTKLVRQISSVKVPELTANSIELSARKMAEVGNEVELDVVISAARRRTWHDHEDVSAADVRDLPGTQPNEIMRALYAVVDTPDGRNVFRVDKDKHGNSLAWTEAKQNAQLILSAVGGKAVLRIWTEQPVDLAVAAPSLKRTSR